MTVTLTEKQKRAVGWIVVVKESGEREYGCTLTISMRK